MARKKRNELTNDLIDFFKVRIGASNGAFKEEIYQELYGKPFNKKSMKHFTKWKGVAVSMTKLRKSGFMIKSEKVGSYDHIYYIPKTTKESSEYTVKLAKPAKTMLGTIERTNSFVLNKVYKYMRKL